MPTWCTFRNAARKEHVARESTDAAAEIAIKPQAPEFQNSPLKIFGQHDENTIAQMKNSMAVGNVVSRRHMCRRSSRLRPAGRRGHCLILYAFEILELDGADLRRAPVEERKRALERLLRKAKPGLRLNEHIDEPGDIVFRHACKLGLEGIVSKGVGSSYRSGRSPDWLKFKNPAAPAVKREAEEDWGR
jgi:hypothetical protein